MPQASGLGSSFGLKKETTYGTAVVVDKFYEYDSEGFGLDPSFLESGGLRAGRTFQQAARTKKTTHQAPGSVSLDVPTKGFGAILDLLHGASVSPVQQGGTAAYLQTHPIGTTLVNKSATVQVNKPDTSATDRAFTTLGAMVASWQFSLDTSGVLKCQLTFDGRDEKTDIALAPASYVAGVDSFDFTDALVTTLAGANLASVTGFTLSGSNTLKTNRWFLGSGALKAKPIPTGFTEVTGTLDCEFESLSAYNHFAAGNPIAIVIPIEGAVIAATHKYTWKADMPACQIRGETPKVGGPDVLTQTIPFKVLDDGTNAPLTLTYMSTDTAL